MNKTNIAFWGLGKHSEKLLPIISKNKHLQLFGVCSRNIDILKKISDKYECFAWNNPSEMLNNKNLDVIYISLPIAVHSKAIVQSIKHNKHVWCEKPLTNSHLNTKKCVMLAEENGKSISEGFMYLYHPQFLKFKELIKSLDRISILCSFGIPMLENPGFRHNKLLGGGAFWDIGCYPISLITEIFLRKNLKLSSSKIIFDEKLNIDVEGFALFNGHNCSRAYIEWAYGKSYKNEISVWSKEKNIFSKYIFSKPSNYDSTIIIHDLYGKKKIESIINKNQFELMFNQFLKNISNKKASKNEHKNIIKRSKLMNAIINNKECL